MCSNQEQIVNNLIEILIRDHPDYQELLEPITNLTYEKKMDLILGEFKQFDKLNPILKKKYYFLQRKLEKMSSITPFYVSCQEQFYILKQIFDKNLDLHFKIQIVPRHIKYAEKKILVEGLIDNEQLIFQNNLDKESLINLLLMLPEDDPVQQKIKEKKATFYDKIVSLLQDDKSSIAVASLIFTASKVHDILVEAGIASPFAGVIPMLKSLYYGFKEKVHLLISPNEACNGQLVQQLTNLHQNFLFSGKLLVIGNFISIGVILYSCYRLQKELRKSKQVVKDFYDKLDFYECEIKRIYKEINYAINKIDYENDSEQYKFYETFYRAMRDANSMKEELLSIALQISKDVIYMEEQIQKQKRQKIYLVICGVVTLGMLIIFPPGGVYNVLCGFGILISAGEYFFTDQQIKQIIEFKKDLQYALDDVKRLISEVYVLQEYITKNSQLICDTDK